MSKHHLGVAALTGALVSLTLPAAGGAAAATLRVCPHGCVYNQVSAAVAAANSGDTITVAPGTYAGGFAITKSLSVAGAGAGRTIIKGGGPVITVGTFGTDSEPTVSISGVTVTGGVTNSSDQSEAFFGDPNVWAIGGGIYIPFADGFTPGATLTVTDSVISGNQVTPTSSAPIGPLCPGNVPCPFAEAAGGGIGDEGNVTLVRTAVTGNRASGGTTSDADGAGIWIAHAGTLTMRDSTVSGNLARTSDPNGRSTDGAGIFAVQQATVTLSDSSVSANTASLSSSFPFDLGGGNFLEVSAHAGGIHLSDGDTTVISDSHIDNNAVFASDPNGQLEVFDAGLCDCGQGTLSMRDSTVSGNTLTAVMASNTDVFADTGYPTGAFEFDGPATVSDTRIENNATTVIGLDGPIVAGGAVNAFADPGVGPGLITDSTISGNTVRATSPVAATILGGGIVVAGSVELRDDTVKANTEKVAAPAGAAQGGGIWVGTFPGPPFTGQLTAKDVTVTGNVLSGSNPSILLQGGGLYTANPVTLTDTTITRNTPNNCTGATC